MSRKKKQLSKPSWFSASLRSGVMFVAGTIFGLFLNAYFVRLLPGPIVHAYITKMDVRDGEAAGCTIYHVDLTADKPLDFLYFDVQFPRNISDYKVSAGERAVTPGRAIGSYTLFAYGKNSSGDCDVR